MKKKQLSLDEKTVQILSNFNEKLNNGDKKATKTQDIQHTSYVSQVEVPPVTIGHHEEV